MFISDTLVFTGLLFSSKTSILKLFTPSITFNSNTASKADSSDTQPSLRVSFALNFLLLSLQTILTGVVSSADEDSNPTSISTISAPSSSSSSSNSEFP